jgi:Flp pilus assembly protein TadG
MPPRRSIRNEHGQALVEFTLALPLLAIVLLGIFQVGIAFNHYLTLTDAVRTGARAATVDRHLADPESDVEAKLRAAATGLEPADLDVSVSSSWDPGSPVTVTASYPYEINLLGVVVRSGDLTSTTQERVE